MTYTDDCVSLSHTPDEVPTEPTRARDDPVLAAAITQLSESGGFSMKAVESDIFLGTAVHFVDENSVVTVDVHAFIADMAKALSVTDLPSNRMPLPSDHEYPYGAETGCCSPAQCTYNLKASGCIGWIVREQDPSLKAFHTQLASVQTKPTLKWYRTIRHFLKFVFDNAAKLIWKHHASGLTSRLITYVDASHHDDLDLCGTTIGSVTFSGLSCLQATSKKKKNLVSCGTAGNEMRALSAALNESLRLYVVLQGADFDFDEPLGLVSDNVAALIMMPSGKIPESSRYLKPNCYVFVNSMPMQK